MGRRGELAVFRETFARNPEETDFPFLFHVRGNAGVGKSTLARQWEAAAIEQPSAITAFVGDEVHDAVEAMEAVSDRLGRRGHPLKRFDKQLATYRQRRHQAESAVPAPQPVSPGDPGAEPAPTASPSSTVAAQVGLAGLGLVPGIGAFVGAVDPQQVALGADRMRAALNTRLRSHDDVQLVMRPLSVLTPVFLEDLAEVAERCERVVLFFDVYERTAPVLDTWLRDIVFGDEYGGLPVNVQVVLSGQLRLDARIWGDHLGQITEVHLEVFSEEEARTLLAGHGVVEEAGVELVLRLSGRLPLLVDMLARSGARTGEGFEDPSETAVERFLKWEPLAERREAALACALPLQLDEDIYRAAAPEDAVDGYPWLRGLAFVSSQSGRCRYHEVVRAAMLRLQRTRSRLRWEREHMRLAEVFRGWRLAAEGEIGTDPEDHWRDAAWREFRSNETYHLLCANSRAALPDALRQSAHAVGRDAATLRRWAQILVGAGLDADVEALRVWGDRLEATADDEEEGGLTALTLLLGAPELDSSGRALVHSLRAREYRMARDAESALADCVAAVALAPDEAGSHAGLGETYRLLGRHEEAVNSCGRALEIDPGYVIALGSRGDAHRNLGHHEEALADFGRALGLDPQYAWAHSCRAQVYEALGRPDDALVEYDRAIEANAEYVRAMGSRAELLRRLGRYEEALEGFGRALGLDPQYAWAHANRALAHEALGRHDDALADYARAVEIDPLYEWAYASRAELLGRLGRHQEAFADYARAIGIDPEYAWAHTMRAALYESSGRHEEALAGYARAIAADPEFAPAHAKQAALFGALGRHEEALASYARAVSVSPDYFWALASRGELYGGIGRHQEAVADFTRAIELDPRSGWALSARAQTYLRMGRYTDALPDCFRAVEIDPEEGWYQMLYGLALRAAGERESSDDRFSRARRLFSEAGGSPADIADASRGLLVLACVVLDDEDAVARCERFLALRPDGRTVRETVDDLSFLRDVLPESGPCAEAILARLRETR
ncbi:tetratricopeptide repeat protein [Streptomyces sp. NPDC048590]|uniref:tetratricopeptide repeat protein n=1 Tax=Streptomyces sp. NPDC048590 TaxID=3365574 RepID=UPI00371C1645